MLLFQNGNLMGPELGIFNEVLRGFSWDLPHENP